MPDIIIIIIIICGIPHLPKNRTYTPGMIYSQPIGKFSIPKLLGFKGFLLFAMTSQCMKIIDLFVDTHF